MVKNIVIILLLCFYASTSILQLKSNLRRKLQATKESLTKEQEVQEFFEFMNQIRENPRSIIDKLKGVVALFEGNTIKWPKSSGQWPQTTIEGPAAYQELISYLESASPRKPLKWSEGIAKSCRDMAKNLKDNDMFKHEDSEGRKISKRMADYGKYSGRIGENLAAGKRSGRDSVIQLMVDDGTKSRGHRINIMREDFGVAGVALSEHPTYGWMWVTNFAQGFKSNNPADDEQAENAQKTTEEKDGKKTKSTQTTKTTNDAKTTPLTANLVKICIGLLSLLFSLSC